MKVRDTAFLLRTIPLMKGIFTSYIQPIYQAYIREHYLLMLAILIYDNQEKKPIKTNN